MVWAVSKDPFKRDWFTLRTPNHGKVEGVAVLPKPIRSAPVVFFVYGSGGSLITSGNYLRQFAELGMAAVVLEYDPGTSQEAFNEQFMALREYVAKQPWANMDRTAWVGFSRGAQQTGQFLIEHPEAAPRLYVRVGGGMVGGRRSPLDPVRFGGGVENLARVLLIHGENDATFPLDIAIETKAVFKANSVPVDLLALPGQGHAFGMDRYAAMRAIGEYVKAFLTPEKPLPELPVTKNFPFLLCIAPAFLWGGFWICFRLRSVDAAFSRLNPRGAALTAGRTPLWEKLLRCAAAVLAILAIAQTAVHLGTPRLAVSDGTLGIARGWLIPEKWARDFDTIAYEPYWRGGHRLRTLLTHVELSNYCVYELINWQIDQEIYDRYVLSPIIVSDDAFSSAELNWRRPLWEFFYPRIRKENYTEHAARIIVRNLRERVTIAEGDFPLGVESIWRNQIANEEGFERVYVAALRSAGVPARLDQQGETELWTGLEWQSAPRPPIGSWLSEAQSPSPQPDRVR